MSRATAGSGTEKHLVLVVSGGRTGTMFFGDLLDTVVDDAFSVHEPDVFVGFKRKSWERIRRFGLYHMVVGRVLGRTGMRNLSQRFLAGRLSPHELVRQIRRHRDAYYASIEEDLIIEANYQWYGILPGVPGAFDRYRVVAVTRDPRPWVESWLKHGGHHGPDDRVTKWGFRRLNPAMIGDEEYAGRWGRMSPFERNCWDWRTIYGCLHSWVETDPASRLFRFEDLFLAEEREEAWRELLEFVTRFPDRRFPYEFDPSILGVRKNVSQEASPDRVAERWRGWSRDRARRLEAICGELMREFGYGEEPEWLELVGADG